MLRDFLAAGGNRVIKLSNSNGETPLDFMLEYSQDDEGEHFLRAAGAKTAAERMLKTDPQVLSSKYQSYFIHRKD